MHTNTLKILSIIPGTRYVGIAIFNGSELRDWFIKSLRGTSIKEKMATIHALISNFIDRYEINVLAVKKLHSARSSKNLSSIVACVKEIGRKTNLKILEFSIEEMKQSLLNGKSNKKRLMEEVYKTYPFLYSEWEREKKNKNRYFTRMFEAVALGIVCFSKLDNGHRKVETRHH